MTTNAKLTNKYPKRRSLSSVISLSPKLEKTAIPTETLRLKTPCENDGAPSNVNGLHNGDDVWTRKVRFVNDYYSLVLQHISLWDAVCSVRFLLHRRRSICLNRNKHEIKLLEKQYWIHYDWGSGRNLHQCRSSNDDQEIEFDRKRERQF